MNHHPPRIHRDEEIARFDRATKRPKQRTVGHRLVDAVATLQETSRWGPQHVDVFAEALSFSDAFMLEEAGRWLARLAHEFRPACEALETLARHRHWRVRFNVVCTMLFHPPRALMVPLVRQGLADASYRVRQRAVSLCAERRLTELLPDLESLRTVEKAAAVIREIDLAIPLVKGEEAQRNGLITRQLPGGGLAIASVEEGISEDVIGESVADAVNRERRAEPDSPGKRLLRSSQLARPAPAGGDVWLVYDIPERGQVFYDGRTRAYRYVPIAGTEQRFLSIGGLIGLLDTMG